MCAYRENKIVSFAKSGVEVNIEALSNSKIGQFFIRVIAALMESRFRYRFFGPMQILRGADIHPGQTIVELGCGTGFFTIPAAQLIGDQGSLVAMDVLPASVETVSKKAQIANLKNVRVVKGDALNTKLDPESMDAVLLFGILPAPMLPLDRLLPEMYRILKPGGIMAVWPPSWVPQSIPRSRLFTYASKRNGVFNFRRS
jgi:demethylmenaquinone methyltransferase/2-methoxy-6-polyprenyl-1,4-benzoquinol methylase